MERLPLIERVLREHEIAIRVNDPWGVRIQLRIAVPDLRSAPRRVWGDWGPMYTVVVPRDRRLALSVWSETHVTPAGEVLDLDQVEIDSPASALTRALTPLVMKLPLARRHVTLLVYYDPQGRPARAEIQPLAGLVAEYGVCEVLDGVTDRSDDDARLVGSAAAAGTAPQGYGRHA